MVTILLTFAVLSPVPGEGDDAITRALARGDYPWYDAARDQARPIPPPPPLNVPNVRTGWWEFGFSWVELGQFVVFLVLAAGLIALIVFLVKTWNRYLEQSEPHPQSRKGPALSSRSAALPAGLHVETDDPWAEAISRRERDDLAGAIVCLFVSNLILLEERGRIRLTPGRTGRQLIRSIADTDLRHLAEPTLRLFEAAYYGHQKPDPDAFATAWDRAENLRGRLISEAAR